MTSPNYIAGGTIQPSTFVEITGSNTVSQASDDTDILVGVCQAGSSVFPTPGGATAAATVGQPIQVFGPGEICLLSATSAGWTAGQLLTSNASGQGLAASSGNIAGAIALTTLSAAALGPVLVLDPLKQ